MQTSKETKNLLSPWLLSNTIGLALLWKTNLMPKFTNLTGSIYYHYDLRPRSIEAEFMSSDGNFVRTAAHTCYLCFGPLGIWRASFESGYSWVTCTITSQGIGMYFLLFWRPKCAFQHWRKQLVSNTRVNPGGKYGRTSGPKRVLSWVEAHLLFHTMHEVPELRGASILKQNNLLWVAGGSSITDHPVCFLACFAMVTRQKIGLNGINSHMQWMKWNDGLFWAAHQCGEVRQSYGRAPVGWPQPFPPRSTPNGRKSHTRWAF